MGVLIFAFVFIVMLGVFMLLRSEWVGRVCIAHTEVVCAFIQKKFEEANTYGVVLSGQYYHCIWDSDRMWWHFWVWDLRKMVSDRERFDEVYRTPEDEELDALRKTVAGSTHVANLSRNVEKQ